MIARLATRLWNDEAGFIISLELVITAVLLVFGIIVGLESLREATIIELGDLADAIAALDGSGSYVPSMGIMVDVAPKAEGEL